MAARAVDHVATGARRGAGGPRHALVALLGAAALLFAALAPGIAQAQDAVPDADPTADADAPDDAPMDADELTPVTVGDTFFAQQWHLRETRVPEAWNLTRGDPNITIAVVDTGVDPAHLDLRGAFWRDPSTGTPGLDLVNGTSIPYVSPAQDWHGTAVAGVAAARADDGYGIAGVAPGVSVMVMRVYASEDGQTAPMLGGGYGSAVDAIDRAADLGADVILLPWGGQDPSRALRDVIGAAGVPVVVAAGNDGSDLSADVPATSRYPAMYSLPNLVTVTASDVDGELWSDPQRGAANVGEQHVGIAAPGELIIGPVPDAGHTYYGGTSFAAPQVAGALALALSMEPQQSPGELIGELLRTARPAPAFADRVISGGVLDVAAFLVAVQRPRCAVDPPPAGFVDVDPDSSHAGSIDCVAWWGIAEGIGEDRYAPARAVTRGQMATFLTRTLARAGARPDPATLPDPDDPEAASFTDTAPTTHAQAIEVVAALGIAQGRDDGTFRPNDAVTRGQMAAFLARAVEHVTGTAPRTDRQWFDDTVGTTHELAINAVRELAITLGTGEPRQFDPYRDVTRAQMASFLARTLDALTSAGIALDRP